MFSHKTSIEQPSLKTKLFPLFLKHMKRDLFIAKSNVFNRMEGMIVLYRKN